MIVGVVQSEERFAGKREIICRPIKWFTSVRSSPRKMIRHQHVHTRGLHVPPDFHTHVLEDPTCEHSVGSEKQPCVLGERNSTRQTSITPLRLGRDNSSHSWPASSNLKEAGRACTVNVLMADRKLEAAIRALDENSARSLLLGAAEASPSLAKLILEASHDSEPVRDVVPVRDVDFDQLSKDAWHLLKTHQHSRLDAVATAFDAVRNIVVRIVSNTHGNTTFATKRSAMHTLRKIGKSIMLSPGPAAEEVRRRCKSDTMLTDAMSTVAGCMSIEEKIRLSEESNREFIVKLEELDQLSESNGMIFPDLDLILESLGPDGGVPGGSGTFARQQSNERTFQIAQV